MPHWRIHQRNALRDKFFPNFDYYLYTYTGRVDDLKSKSITLLVLVNRRVNRNVHGHGYDAIIRKSEHLECL